MAHATKFGSLLAKALSDVEDKDVLPNAENVPVRTFLLTKNLTYFETCRKLQKTFAKHFENLFEGGAIKLIVAFTALW